MKIEVQSLNFSLSLAQHRYIEDRLAFALESNAHSIQQVELWLSDLNLAAGDTLKRCVIQILLDDGTMVISESSDPGLRVVIHRAIDQAGWKVARSIGQHAGSKPPLAAVQGIRAIETGYRQSAA